MNQNSSLNMASSYTKWPKITIVTPSYNQGRFIEATILSILNQEYPNLEYIIIDGGSTDETIEILKKYDKHISYWISEKDQGQSHAIIKGLEKATGTIFNWVNSDDILESKALFYVGKLYNKYQFDILVGTGRIVTIDHANKPIKEELWKAKLWDFPSDFLRPYGVVLPQASTFINLETLKRIGSINKSLHYVMDWELYFRLAQEEKLKKITTDQILSQQLIHNESKTYNFSERFSKEYVSVLKDTTKKEDISLKLQKAIFYKLDRKSVV